MRECAAIHTHEDLVPYLLQHRHMTCVHAAAQLGCLECLKWMVEHVGLPPNDPDTQYGATPLHYAANGGHSKLVKFLLSRISRVKVDFDGATPLHEAAVQGNTTCVQELLKSHLVDPDVTDNYGLTAMEWADNAQQKKCVKLLKTLDHRSSSLSKRKKCTMKRSKQHKAMTAFIQYSDPSTNSQCSGSPLSDTYAQLDPPECMCPPPPQNLPPRLPDTPRPNQCFSPIRARKPKFPSPEFEHVAKASPLHCDLHRRPVGEVEFEHELRTQVGGRIEPHQAGDLDEPFPPPPLFLDCASNQCFVPVPNQKAPYFQPQEERVFQRCTAQTNTTCHKKPVTAVLPFNKQPNYHDCKESSYGETHIAIGRSPIQNTGSNPPAPIQCFTTFSCNSVWLHQEAPPSVQQTTPQSTCAEYDNGKMKKSEESQFSADVQAVNNRLNQRATDFCERPSDDTPLWKKQLIEQKEKRRVDDMKKVTEIADIPDWKRLIQERKLARSPHRVAQPEGPKPIPWQNEAKCNRIIAVHSED